MLENAVIFSCGFLQIAGDNAVKPLCMILCALVIQTKF